MSAPVPDVAGGDKVISTTDLRKSFRSPRGPVTAVDGVSIGVERGEIFGFLGPNGAGKTTTLRMLTTLLPIDGGQATVAGFDVGRQPKEVRSRIGYVSQLGGADDLATGRENLLLQGRLYGGDLDSVTRRTRVVMDVLDLADFADRRVKTYSGGQRRRLDIALGIIHEPEVLFLDEPSTGLDPQNRANLWEHVRHLRDGGTTIFLTTHYLEEADSCDRVAIVDAGAIVEAGEPAALKRRLGKESVELSSDDPRALAAQVELLTGIAPRVRGETVSIIVEDAAAVMPLLLPLADQDTTIRLTRPTLEDVFVSVTRQEESRDAARS